ncbi:MAG: rod shape-determining protein MreD [Eggerthellaceae bacterium]|nr:rod shape-determining protein MreD [Eggerthellaceae bacterium]
MSRVIILVAGAILALALQIIIAPNIAVFSAMPNFCAAYVIVVAIVRPTNNSSLLLAFLMGLAFDLLGHGPVGIMAFLLVLVAFIASRAFLVFDNDTIFMPIVMLLVGCFLVEIFYAVFMVSFGVAPGFVDAFIYKALPCAVYDCVVGLIFFPLGMKFLTATQRSIHAGDSHKAMQVTLTTSQDLGRIRTKKHGRF